MHPDKLLSVIEEKNALEQFPGSVPVVYSGAFMLSNRGALPSTTLGWGANEEAPTIEDGILVLEARVRNRASIAAIDGAPKGMVMTTSSALEVASSLGQSR